MVELMYSATCPPENTTFVTNDDKYNQLLLSSATYNCDRPLKFAAVKMTAIVNPTLLVSVSTVSVNI